jgi:hypothetical protein
MRIRYADKKQTKIKWDLYVSWNGFSFFVTVETEDGNVWGTEDSNVATSYLPYLDECSQEERKIHFDEFKKYIENEIADHHV